MPRKRRSGLCDIDITSWYEFFLVSDSQEFHSNWIQRVALYNNIVDIGDIKDMNRVETFRSMSICMAVLAILSLVANTLLAFDSKSRKEFLGTLSSHHTARPFVSSRPS